ncbi:hypothetical protein C8J56DRAFT_1058383 [Mycena floridula]|nr:hypothetical protein C8J56DRAFT_1058383 [Mycena floridula]
MAVQQNAGQIAREIEANQSRFPLLHDLEMVELLEPKSGRAMNPDGRSPSSILRHREWMNRLQRRTSMFCGFGLEAKGVGQDLAALDVIAMSIRLNSSICTKGSRPAEIGRGRPREPGAEGYFFTTPKLRDPSPDAALCQLQNGVLYSGSILYFGSTRSFLAWEESIKVKEFDGARKICRSIAQQETRGRVGPRDGARPSFLTPEPRGRANLVETGFGARFLTPERIDDYNLTKQKLELL